MGTCSDIFFGEVIGTAVLILLGGGVCAAVTFKKSKAFNAGWVAIAFGWGFAVLTAVYMVGGLSGAHLNPAVTTALALTGSMSLGEFLAFISGQMLGAFIGAVLVYVAYYGQFMSHLTTDREVLGGPGTKDGEAPASGPGPVLGVFSTAPEIRKPWQNLATEIIATAVLILAVLTQGLNADGDGLGILGGLITALVVVSIGFSLGGPTGYAVNPARDLGPRIAHAVLPMPNKGSSDWSYAWIPVVGPLLGALLASGIYELAFHP
ncbi:MIP/aquaporin family protein [Streptomyces polyrhachis]|uniref:MIP/aquaporin family protein n=1 Tax=Streptomyces polyrhachis TaxID=1282885 RepID=A0ABW2GDE7_9ACTN